MTTKKEKEFARVIIPFNSWINSELSVAKHFWWITINWKKYYVDYIFCKVSEDWKKCFPDLIEAKFYEKMKLERVEEVKKFQEKIKKPII